MKKLIVSGTLAFLSVPALIFAMVANVLWTTSPWWEIVAWVTVLISWLFFGVLAVKALYEGYMQLDPKEQRKFLGCLRFILEWIYRRKTEHYV